MYTCGMSNVLDLKNPPEASNDDTTDVVTPIEALTIPESNMPMNLDELAALTLAATAAPRTVAWEAHHPLSGTARMRHYYLLGGLVALGVLVAWWQASFLVFVVVLLGAGALEVSERWSKPTAVAIDEHGVAVDGRHHAHADLASFDIHTMPDGTVELSVQTSKWHAPHMRLPLGEQDPTEVRAVMAQYVPEGRHKIPLWDYLIRKP
jgi:hypothetical protein